MNTNELEKQIRILERIRDIQLSAGIRSDAMDASFQKVCNSIDELYGQLLGQTKAAEDMPGQ